MSEKFKINGLILKWTRESLGMSFEELAAKTKIKVDLLRNLEDESKQPSFAQIKKLAKILKRPTATFFLSIVPIEPEIPKDFRVLKEADIIKLAPKTIYEIRKAQRKREIALDLAEELKLEIPTFNYKATMNEDVVKLASKFRKMILRDQENSLSNLAEGRAFEIWKEGLETLGVLVLQASLDSLEEMRGLAVYNQKYPLILINTKDSPRGKIFSLLHEFCHLLLHKSGIGNINPNWQNTTSNTIEVFCNAFAAESILPTNLFMSDDEVLQLKNNEAGVTRQKLFKLANKFQASWEVVLRRLLDKGFISNDFYGDKRGEIKKYFAGKKKSSAVIPYDQRVLNLNGQFFTNLVVESFNQDKITAKDVADYLGAKFQHFEKIQKRLNQKARGA